MSLPRDLLEQAHHLARREPRRPRQASLRRAVSAAYYALFHLLINEATCLLVTPALRTRFYRAFEHGDMKNASRAFVGTHPTSLDALTGGLAIPPELEHVASTFLFLQEWRHDADYNTEATFTRSQVRNLIAQAWHAFDNWQAIRTSPVARVYLAALLLWRKWSR